jgi:hypothetical protein
MEADRMKEVLGESMDFVKCKTITIKNIRAAQK